MNLGSSLLGRIPGDVALPSLPSRQLDNDEYSATALPDGRRTRQRFAPRAACHDASQMQPTRRSGPPQRTAANPTPEGHQRSSVLDDASLSAGFGSRLLNTDRIQPAPKQNPKIRRRLFVSATHLPEKVGAAFSPANLALAPIAARRKTSNVVMTSFIHGRSRRTPFATVSGNKRSSFPNARVYVARVLIDEELVWLLHTPRNNHGIPVAIFKFVLVEQLVERRRSAQMLRFRAIAQTTQSHLTKLFCPSKGVRSIIDIQLKPSNDNISRYLLGEESISSTYALACLYRTS